MKYRIVHSYPSGYHIQCKKPFGQWGFANYYFMAPDTPVWYETVEAAFEDVEKLKKENNPVKGYECL